MEGGAAMTPLVSVIVPVYNGARYLPGCIRSLQAQTEPNIEIILVDDGSADGSGAICDRFAGEDGRIVVCHQKNGGVSAARNRGLELARGKYVMFCDCDDAVLPAYCQTHLADMARPGVALTISANLPLPPQAVPLADDGRAALPPYSLLLRLWRDSWLWYCWGKCFDLERIRSRGLRFPEGLSHSEDTAFVVEYILGLLDAPGRILIRQAHLYCYYDTPGGLSKHFDRLADAIACKQALARRLDERVGFDARELEGFLDCDRVGLLNHRLRSRLDGCPWYAMGTGYRRIRDAVRSPDFGRMLELDERCRSFNRRYRAILSGRRPLVIYLYLRIWRLKNRLAALPPLGRRRRLLER